MNRKQYLLYTLCLCVSLLTVSATTYDANKAYAFTNQVMQKGAIGVDVIELQARLQYIGFYKGKIDGKFGWSTYWALRNFQKDYGLKVDGIAGANTKRILSKHTYYNRSWVLGNVRKSLTFTYYAGMPLKDQVKHRGTSGSHATASQAPSSSKTTSSSYNVSHLPTGFSKSDIQLMSDAVYGEARGEPFKGQVAVAAVILNRVSSSKFPDNVSGVIFQPGAFTAVQDGQIWLGSSKETKKAVIDAMNGWDPSQGALYYFNPNTATSGWVWGRPQIKKIGKHIFTK